MSGFELVNKIKDQASKYGVEFLYDEVIHISQEEEEAFLVKTKNSEYLAVSIILAIGKIPRDLNVEGESEFKNRGVSYCAVCDGPLYAGKSAAVVGVGEQALESAIFLSNIAKKVYLIQRTEKPVCDEDKVTSLLRLGNVEIVHRRVISKIKGNGKLESVDLSDPIQPGIVENLKIDALFVEMGYTTRIEFVKNLVSTNSKNEIVIDQNGKTITDGIFACGDITNIPYKQAVISAGQGAIAALSAYNYIQKLRGKPASINDWKKLGQQNNVDFKL
nr:FAD-dependent oxidoreductase [Thermoplasma sp.]